MKSRQIFDVMKGYMIQISSSFRTLDGSWQMMKEHAHTHPRVNQVSRLPLGVQKCGQERGAGNLFPQPRPHQLL